MPKSSLQTRVRQGKKKERASQPVLYCRHGHVVLRDGKLVCGGSGHRPSDHHLDLEEIVAFALLRRQLDMQRVARILFLLDVQKPVTVQEQKPPRHEERLFTDMVDPNGVRRYVLGTGIGTDGEVWAAFSTPIPGHSFLCIEGIPQWLGPYFDAGNVGFSPLGCAFWIKDQYRKLNICSILKSDSKTAEVRTQGPFVLAALGGEQFHERLYTRNGLWYEAPDLRFQAINEIADSPRSLTIFPFDQKIEPGDQTSHDIDGLRDSHAWVAKASDGTPAHIDGHDEAFFKIGFEKFDDGQRLNIGGCPGPLYNSIHAWRIVHGHENVRLVYLAERNGKLYKVTVRLRG